MLASDLIHEHYTVCFTNELINNRVIKDFLTCSILYFYFFYNNKLLNLNITIHFYLIAQGIVIRVVNDSPKYNLIHY